MSLPPFRLERFFARYEHSVEHVLCASDCESVSVAELLALEPGAEDGLRELRLGYTESSGSPELRREIASLYETVDADDVLVFSGGEEAIYALMQVALEPASRLFVHFPSYQSLHEVARGRAARWCAGAPGRTTAGASTRRSSTGGSCGVAPAAASRGGADQLPPQPHRLPDDPGGAGGAGGGDGEPGAAA